MKCLGNTIRGLTQQNRRTLYLSCILPVLTYTAPVWFRPDKQQKHLLDPLVKIQSEALRWTLGVFRTTPLPALVMIFASFSPSFLFLSKSQAPTHSTSLNHDMFPHSLSYLISCPTSFILSFIFFRSFWLEGKLSHLGLLGLETFGPWEDEHRTIYCGAMSNCSPTKESTHVVAIELILSWTSSQVNSGLGSILSNNEPSGLGDPMI